MKPSFFPPQPPAAGPGQALGDSTLPVAFSLWGTAEIFSDPPRADQSLHATFQGIPARRLEHPAADHAFHPAGSIIGGLVEATIFVLVFSFVTNRQKPPVFQAARLRRFLGARLGEFANVSPSKLDEMLVAAAGNSFRRRFTSGLFRFWMFSWMFGSYVFLDYARSTNWPYPERPWWSWLVLLAFAGIMVPFVRRWQRDVLLRELHRLRAVSPVTA